MRKLQESLLDDDDKLFKNTNNTSVEANLSKDWVNNHIELKNTINDYNNKHGILSLTKIENNIPKYVKLNAIEGPKQYQRLYLDIYSKSLDIEGVFENFNTIIIENYEKGGYINFKTPMHIKYLIIKAPYLTSVDLSKITIDEFVLDECYELDIDKCKFPKNKCKFRLSGNVNKKILADAYKKHGLDPSLVV